MDVKRYEEFEFEIQVSDEFGGLDGRSCIGFDNAKKEFRNAIVERFSSKMNEYILLINTYCENHYPQKTPMEIINLVDLLKGISSNANYLPDRTKKYTFDDGKIAITYDGCVLCVKTAADAIKKFPILKFKAFEMNDVDTTYGFLISDGVDLDDFFTIQVTMQKAEEVRCAEDDDIDMSLFDNFLDSDKGEDDKTASYNVITYYDGWESVSPCQNFDDAKLKFRKEISQELNTKIMYYTEMIRDYCDKYYPKGMPDELKKVITLLKRIVKEPDYFDENAEELDFEVFTDERITVFTKTWEGKELYINSETDEFPIMEISCLDMNDEDEEYYFFISDLNRENKCDIQLEKTDK